MSDYLNQILLSQFEAALGMFRACVEACPPEHWEGKIANGSFRQIAYHTLFFVDAYLSPSEAAFELRPHFAYGGDERLPVFSAGLSQAETLRFADECRDKLIATLTSESRETLEGPSGFASRRISRGELHLYNLRHVQHHTGQFSAYLRRVAPERFSEKALPWIGRGC